jgi:hypothetical protein
MPRLLQLRNKPPRDSGCLSPCTLIDCHSLSEGMCGWDLMPFNTENTEFFGVTQSSTFLCGTQAVYLCALCVKESHDRETSEIVDR